MSVGCSRCGGTGGIPAGPFGGGRDRCPDCGGDGSIAVTPPEIERPSACPKPGTIQAFDAGWNAHEVGLDRATVEFFTPESGKGWALLAYDVRAKLLVGGNR